ncbi:hypothetical protein TRICI_004087 [Trichomonascus ciferrii]|uniref:Kinesin-like protein n=1 Tax=Trichomonascus ciferrii TaxID=44093 RepID=A0A642V240_9ASCO|nr:hypothetical protein TRICI_004087 [Trichomonascus ciferrii]
MATVRQTAAGGDGGFKSPTLMSPRSSLYGSPLPRSNSVLQARSPTPTGREGVVAVNVAVRIRPPLDPDDPNAEIVPSRFKNGVVEAPTANTVTIASPHSTSKKRFLFDRVFEQSTSQIGVWNYVASCVPSLIQGYNVSIMAYGQSGSGKSYTMGTSHGITDSSRLGIIPRAASALFEELENPSPSAGDASPTKRVRPPSLNISPRNMLMGGGDVKLDAKPWTVSVSYLEIYNEQLRDLLASDNGVNANTGKSHLAIREDVKGNISVKGLQEVVVETADELLQVLERGSASRQTNSTAVNSQSSRSHAIFTIHLTQKQLKPETGIITTITSKLNLVDLAGSERLKNTGTANEGRVKEGISINSGLTSLGKVISQLSSRPGAHISYRDSKLTRALQDSLGGKAITHLIACVTPEAFYSSESLNTLTYAQRARAIQLTPEIQQGETSKEDLLQLVAQLRQEVQFWKAKANETAVGSPMLSTPSTPSLADFSTSSNYQPDTPLTSDLSNMDICPPGSVESTRERVSRSTAFHNAVESIISDYEQTIQSLQESVALSRTSALELSDMVHEKEDLLMEAHNANQELAELVEQLQQTIQSLKTHNDHGELVSDLETQVVELKTELSSYRNEHKRHLSESQYLTSQYNNSRREIETLTREKEELQQRIRSLELKGTVLNASRTPSGESTSSSTSSRGIRELETPTKIHNNRSSDKHSRRKRRSSSFFVQASVT